MDPQGPTRELPRWVAPHFIDGSAGRDAYVRKDPSAVSGGGPPSIASGAVTNRCASSSGGGPPSTASGAVTNRCASSASPPLTTAAAAPLSGIAAPPLAPAPFFYSTDSQVLFCGPHGVRRWQTPSGMRPSTPTTVVAYVVMACEAMACMYMDCIVVTYVIVMTYIVTACEAMACMYSYGLYRRDICHHYGLCSYGLRSLACMYTYGLYRRDICYSCGLCSYGLYVIVIAYIAVACVGMACILVDVVMT